MPAFPFPPSDATVEAATSAFGFPAGYWSAGIVWPTPTWADYPARIRSVLTPDLTARSTPSPLLYGDDVLYPDCGAVGALWHQARHAPVSLDALRAAVAADAQPGGPLVELEPSDIDNLTRILLDGGFFAAWPILMDPRWSWDTLYLVPSVQRRDPLWPLVQPDLPGLPLHLHRDVLAFRLMTPVTAWRDMLAVWHDFFREFAQQIRQNVLAPRVATDPIARLFPPLLPRPVLTRVLAEAGFPSANASPTSELHPAQRAATLLLERRLPRVLARGATLIATNAFGDSSR